MLIYFSNYGASTLQQALRVYCSRKVVSLNGFHEDLCGQNIDLGSILRVAWLQFVSTMNVGKNGLKVAKL